MRRLLCAVAKSALFTSALFTSALFVSFFTADRANAAIVVRIDRATQTMQVVVDGVPRYDWRVSTGRRALPTPGGVYHPQRLAARWFSRKYHNSPMPHSIFFRGGIAIHGTYETAGSAVQCRMAACGCSPRTPLLCLAWSSGKAWARRRSWCIEISPSSS